MSRSHQHVGPKWFTIFSSTNSINSLLKHEWRIRRVTVNSSSSSSTGTPAEVNGQENSDQAPNITSRWNTCSQVIRPANGSAGANVTDTLNRADSICCGENAVKHDQEAPRWRRTATMEHAPHPVSVSHTWHWTNPSRWVRTVTHDSPDNSRTGVHAGLFSNNHDHKLYPCLLGCCCQICRTQIWLKTEGKVPFGPELFQAFRVSNTPANTFVKNKNKKRLSTKLTKVVLLNTCGQIYSLSSRMWEFSPKAPLLRRLAQPGRALIHPRDPEKEDPHGASLSLKQRRIIKKAVLLACFPDWMWARAASTAPPCPQQHFQKERNK